LSVLLSLEEAMASEERLPLAELTTLTLDAYIQQRQDLLVNTADSLALEDDNEEDLLDKELPDGDLFIFDQFEEIMTVDPTDLPAKADFFEQLGTMLRNRDRWALFVMRDDYVAGLQSYLHYLPTRLRTRFRLDLPGPKAARQAIQQPAREAGITFEDAAAEQLVNDLRLVQVQRFDGTIAEQPGPAVEPVQLQVVCYRLWQHLPANKTHIEPADITALGDVDVALAAFYADQVALVTQKTGVRERLIRDWFEHQLITRQGIRGQVLQEAAQSQGLDNRAIYGLIDAHLVRAEKRRGATWFELAHDRLIAPVRSDNEQWFAQNLSELQRTAALWLRQGYPDNLLLVDAQLKQAEQWLATYTEALTDNEQEFLEASRKQQAIRDRERRNNRLIRWLAVVASILSVVAIIAFVIADRARDQADKDRDRAEQEYRKALSRKLLSDARVIGGKRLDLALLLSVEANNVMDTLDTRGGIRDALNLSPHLQAYLHGSPSPIVSVAYSPDGTTIASGAQDGTIMFWDAATRQTIGEPVKAHADEVHGLAFSPDGTLLASGSLDGTIRLWASKTHEPVGKTVQSDSYEIWNIAFSPDGTLLASVYQDTNIMLWDVANMQPTFPVLEKHESPVDILTFSPDGSTLASGDEDGSLFLWDVATRELTGNSLHVGDDTSIWSLSFHSDNKTLASTIETGEAILWDTTTAQRIDTFEQPAKTVTFHPQKNIVAIGLQDQTILLWDIEKQQELATLSGHTGAITRLAFSPDGTLLVSGGLDSVLVLWQMNPVPRLARVFAGHTDDVWDVAYNPDGKTIATTGYDGTIRVWDVASGMQLGEPITAHPDIAWDIDFSPDGQTLATTSCGAFDPESGSCIQGEIRFWDIATLQQIAGPIRTTASYIWGIDFSPDGTRLVAGGCATMDTEINECTQGGVSVLDMTSYEQIGDIHTMHDDIVLDVTFSPDGSSLAAASLDRTISVWDVATWEPVRESFEGHTASVWGVEYSPDGTLLASGSEDTKIILWKLATGQPIKTLHGHNASVYRASFSPDGSLLASSSRDGTIRLWDVATRSTIGNTAIPTLVGTLGTNVFSPDGNFLLVGGSDPPVALIFDLRFEQWRETACALAGRNLIQEEWEQYLPEQEAYHKTCPQNP
jgi:WD40 repeat protein